MLDGLEITQFTYFQQCGGLDLDPICAELTYGLERIAAFLQDVDSIYDIVWARDPDTGAPVTYGDVRLAEELQFSAYNFDYADVASLWKHLELYEAECLALLARAKDVAHRKKASQTRCTRSPLPNPRRLRTRAQVLAHLQPPRRPRRHLRHRTRRRHGPHPQPHRRRRQNLRRAGKTHRSRVTRTT